jgi:hypothetical protein
MSIRLTVLGEEEVTDRVMRCSKLLIENGADLNIATGMPLLHSALQERNCEDLVLYMISHGADIYKINTAGRDALGVCRMYRGDSPQLPALMVEAWRKYTEQSRG